MKNKTYFIALIIIFVYLVVIKNITKKEETKKEDSEIKADNNVGGFNYDLADEFLEELEKGDYKSDSKNNSSNKKNNKNNSNEIPADNTIVGGFSGTKYTL